MADWSDGFWSSRDGLELHYRDYAGSATHAPVLCIPGLTRNARDFEGPADRLAPSRRVIAVDLRGRGGSGHAKDPMSYRPSQYAEDVAALVEKLGLSRFVVIGTSLGGLVTMLLAGTMKDRIAAAVLNDIGPVIGASGIARIRSYVGRAHSWPTWLHAARHLAEAQGDLHPGWKIEQWLAHAKRLCRLNNAGRIVFDYDIRIAEPFRLPGGDLGFDPWAAFADLATIPTLLVRGGLSDLLSGETVAAMRAAHPRLELVTIPDVGHAPTLDEPEAVTAIARFLDGVPDA